MNHRVEAQFFLTYRADPLTPTVARPPFENTYLRYNIT